MTEEKKEVSWFDDMDEFDWDDDGVERLPCSWSYVLSCLIMPLINGCINGFAGSVQALYFRDMGWPLTHLGLVLAGGFLLRMLTQYTQVRFGIWTALPMATCHLTGAVLATVFFTEEWAISVELACLCAFDSSMAIEGISYDIFKDCPEEADMARQATSSSLAIVTVAMALACSLGAVVYDMTSWQGISIFHTACQGSLLLLFLISPTCRGSFMEFFFGTIDEAEKDDDEEISMKSLQVTPNQPSQTNPTKEQVTTEAKALEQKLPGEADMVVEDVEEPRSSKADEDDKLDEMAKARGLRNSPNTQGNPSPESPPGVLSPQSRLKNTSAEEARKSKGSEGGVKFLDAELEALAAEAEEGTSSQRVTFQAIAEDSPEAAVGEPEEKAPKGDGKTEGQSVKWREHPVEVEEPPEAPRDGDETEPGEASEGQEKKKKSTNWDDDDAPTGVDYDEVDELQTRWVQSDDGNTVSPTSRINVYKKRKSHVVIAGRVERAAFSDLGNDAHRLSEWEPGDARQSHVSRTSRWMSRVSRTSRVSRVTVKSRISNVSRKSHMSYVSRTSEATLRTSRTSDREPQRRTSQWTMRTSHTRSSAMTGGSVGTMRTNMTMRSQFTSLAEAGTNFEHHFMVNSTLGPTIVTRTGQEGDFEDEFIEDEPIEDIPFVRRGTIAKTARVPLFLVLLGSLSSGFCYATEFGTFSIVFRELYGLTSATPAALGQTGGDFLAAMVMQINTFSETLPCFYQGLLLSDRIAFPPYNVSWILLIWTLLNLGMISGILPLAITSQVLMSSTYCLASKFAGDLCFFYTRGDVKAFMVAQMYMRRAEAFTGAVANLLGLLFVEHVDITTPYVVCLCLSGAVLVLYTNGFCARVACEHVAVAEEKMLREAEANRVP